MSYQPDRPYNELPDLPPAIDIETPAVLRAAIRAHRLLAELKGYCQTLPNPDLLLTTVILQESRDSSAIENIVTTQDELYRAIVAPDDTSHITPGAKEVILYREAIDTGRRELARTGVLSTNLMVRVMQTLRNATEGVRRTSGIKLANPVTGETMYTPPEGESILRDKLHALKSFIHQRMLDTVGGD